MTKLRVLGAATLLGVASTLTTAGHTSAAPHVHRHTVFASFQLRVVTPTAARTSYWVAYGPLAGRFGIVRLHAAGNNFFAATQALPGSGRTVFTYIAAPRINRTPLGSVPGGSTQVIVRLGPVSALHLPQNPVVWQAPNG